MADVTIKKFLGIDSSNKRPDGTTMPHEEKYGTLVEKIGLHRFVHLMPRDRITMARRFDEDPNLNNIGIGEWDKRHKSVASLLVSIGINVLSLAETVCTLKAAARMWVQDAPRTGATVDEVNKRITIFHERGESSYGYDHVTEDGKVILLKRRVNDHPDDTNLYWVLAYYPMKHELVTWRYNSVSQDATSTYGHYFSPSALEAAEADYMGRGE